jgi:hypothetical protein
MTREQQAQIMRRGYQQGLRSKGFTFGTSAGSNTQQLNLAGLADRLEGIAILTSAQGGFVDTRLSFTVNNDTVIDNADARFIAYAPERDLPFYPYQRPLTGQDSISVTVNNANPQDISVIIYYRQRVTN